MSTTVIRLVDTLVRFSYSSDRDRQSRENGVPWNLPATRISHGSKQAGQRKAGSFLFRPLLLSITGVSMKVSTVLDHIDSGHIALPEFQRGYVWNLDQVRRRVVWLLLSEEAS